MFLFIGVTLFVSGWGMFITAIAYTQAYTVAHTMRGYEWIAPFIASLGIVGLIGFPSSKMMFGGDDEAYESEANKRLMVLLGFTVAGLFIGGIVNTTEWFAPPDHKEIAATRGIFSSPSPTPRPRMVNVPSKADPIAGALCMGSVALVAIANCFGYFWATFKPRRSDMMEMTIVPDPE